MSPHPNSNDNGGAYPAREAVPPSRDSVMLVERPQEEHSLVPVHATPGTGRRILILVIGLVVVLTLGFIYRYHRNASAEMSLASGTVAAADAPAPVDVVTVTRVSPQHELVLPGETRAWYQSTIYARVSGYIGSWTADIGDKVKKDQTLALIDTPELDDQLKAAEAKVNADLSEVTVAEANQQFADSTYIRWKESPKGVVSEQEREQKKAEYLSSKAHLAAANSQVELDKAEVNRLKDLTSFKKVAAPYDGVITSRRVDIGDLVTAGSTTGNTPLYDIAKSDKIRVYVDVPQAASADVKNGTKATATVQEYPGRTFTGVVVRNSHAINEEAKTLRVEVDFDNADQDGQPGALQPGMYLEVRFVTTDRKPPLQIPASALNFRTNGPAVAVVAKDGIVRFHNVTIARDLGNVVEVDSGVSEGDRVALNIGNQIADGDKVQPIEQEPGSNAPSSSTTNAVAKLAG